MSFPRLSVAAPRPTRRVAIDRQDREAADTRIAALARELASAINSADATGRDGMREYAIDVLRDSVLPSEEPAAAPEAAPTAAPLNSFALGIPILLVGAVLVPLFPPLGLTLAGFGVLLCAVGLLLAATRAIWTRLVSTGSPPTAEP